MDKNARAGDDSPFRETGVYTVRILKYDFIYLTTCDDRDLKDIPDFPALESCVPCHALTASVNACKTQPRVT